MVKPRYQLSTIRIRKYYMIHPNCVHACTSNCRREGCNCECGEYHDGLDKDEYLEAVSELNAELLGNSDYA